MICKRLIISFLNELELLCWDTSIAIVSTQLLQTLKILFNIYNLLAKIEVVKSIAI